MISNISLEGLFIQLENTGLKVGGGLEGRGWNGEKVRGDKSFGEIEEELRKCYQG